MSTTQLKELADKLTARESKWLSAYLAAKARASDPAWKAEMARRLKRMRAGHGITDTEYRRRHPETSKRASAAAK
jgi:hypothetical protein